MHSEQIFTVQYTTPYIYSHLHIYTFLLATHLIYKSIEVVCLFHCVWNVSYKSNNGYFEHTFSFRVRSSNNSSTFRFKLRVVPIGKGGVKAIEPPGCCKVVQLDGALWRQCNFWLRATRTVSQVLLTRAARAISWNCLNNFALKCNSDCWRGGVKTERESERKREREAGRVNGRGRARTQNGSPTWGCTVDVCVSRHGWV